MAKAAKQVGELVVSGAAGLPANYNPEKALRSIYATPGVVKALQAKGKKAIKDKDPEVLAEVREKLIAVIKAKIQSQATYAVWRQTVTLPPGKRNASGSNQYKKRGQVSDPKAGLPDIDPGDVVIHRWRQWLCEEVEVDDENVGGRKSKNSNGAGRGRNKRPARLRANRQG